MGLYDSFKTSSKLETEGVSLDLGFVKIQVARAGGQNQKYNAALVAINAKHGRALTGRLLPENKVREILYEAYADFIILNWETNTAPEAEAPVWVQGIENPDGGELLPFNKENVLATLRALPAIFDEIKTTAESITFYRQSLLDDATKNS